MLLVIYSSSHDNSMPLKEEAGPFIYLFLARYIKKKKSSEFREIQGHNGPYEEQTVHCTALPLLWNFSERLIGMLRIVIVTSRETENLLILSYVQHHTTKNTVID